MAAVTIHKGAETILVQALEGALLSDVLALHHPIDLPCGGRGKCLRCRVRAKGSLSEASVAERQGLSKSEILAGVRLACLARLTGDAEIWTHEDGASKIKTDGQKQKGTTPPVYKKYGVAVDIGTTTICAQLYGALGLLASASMKNPQTVFGSDVISRIERELSGGGAELAGAVCGGIDQLFEEMSAAAGVGLDEIDTAVVCGNTTMLYLLTGKGTRALSRAPFEADCLFGNWTAAQGIFSALAPAARVYLLPCISAFVGGDITAAILASGMCEAPETTMLVDIGTNGEIVLWHRGQLFTSSTAAGPAFEGSGLSCGSYGVFGAVDGVWHDGSAVCCSTIGGGAAIGICGSGIVDALAVMLAVGAMDETGAMEESPFAICEGVSVSLDDVRGIQLAKSAIRAGLETLRISAGIEWDEVFALYVAGGFGSYLNLKSAMTIGLLPEQCEGRIQVVGNAALAGASMMLEHEEFFSKPSELAKLAKPVALDANAIFMEQYVDHMMFE